MICYLCANPIPEGEPFYNDHERYVCKPCFNEAQRCFVCRFPGRRLQPVEGLGLECEFCRGNLISEESDPAAAVASLTPFVARFGHAVEPAPRFAWVGVRDLRQMQTDADLPPEGFIDDYLRYAYPVYYSDGVYHLLPRLPRDTFLAYLVVQLVAADLCRRYDLPHLAGRTAFHTMARGWAHWIGYEAAGLLGFELERRWLRKWPELGAQGDFERWQRMAEVHKPAKLLAHLRASLPVLARKHLGGAGAGGRQGEGSGVR